jgi:hypothetical protein
MTNSSPWYRWPIEIDGLPFLKMVDLSMAMLVITRWYFFWLYVCIAPPSKDRNIGFLENIWPSHAKPHGRLMDEFATLHI